MEREIKFRAWDGGQMHYDLSMFKAHFNDSDEYPNNDGKLFLSCTDDAGDYNELDLTQYTGLKDKNGKEIYEGDILKHDSSSANGVMEWNETGSWTRFYPLFAFEIIGNIYENPELLTK